MIKSRILVAVLVLFASKQSFAVELEKSAGKALAVAGISLSIIGLVGIIESSKEVDQFVIGRRKALMEAIEKDNLQLQYTSQRDGAARLKNELEALKNEAITASTPELEARIRTTQLLLNDVEYGRRQWGLHLLRSVSKDSKLTVPELAHRIELRYKSLDRIKSRVAKAYGRSNPYYLIALGGAVLAVVGTGVESLQEMPVDELYSRLSDKGKDMILQLIDHEVDAANSETAQNLDSLLQ